jgi:hypothetical protein
MPDPVTVFAVQAARATCWLSGSGAKHNSRTCSAAAHALQDGRVAAHNADTAQRRALAELAIVRRERLSA